MPGMTSIEGATVEQEALLREILAGMGQHGLESIRIRPHEPDFTEFLEIQRNPPPQPTLEDQRATHERMNAMYREMGWPEEPFEPPKPVDLGEGPPAGPYGDEIVIDYEGYEIRTGWEAEQVAEAFAGSSSDKGLTPVSCFVDVGRHSRALEHPWKMPWQDEVRVVDPKHEPHPLTDDEVAELRQDVLEAARRGDARLVSLDVLRPRAHATATRLFVDEAHRFLRFGLRAFSEALATWNRRLGGDYFVVEDAAGAVYECGGHVSRYGTGCTSTRRPDLECCMPRIGFSMPIDYPGPPVCPVFGPPTWGAHADAPAR